MIIFFMSLLSGIVCYLLLSSTKETPSNSPELQKKESSIKISEEKSQKKKNQNNHNTPSDYIIKEIPQSIVTNILMNAFVKYLKKYKMRKININGYYLMTYLDDLHQYKLSNIITDSLKTLSEEVFKYSKLRNSNPNEKNKSKELANMFIECLASINSEKNYKIQKALFNSINWTDQKFGNNNNNDCNNEQEECLISKYIRYRNELSLEKKMNIQKEIKYMLYENDYEDEIIGNHSEIGIVRSFPCNINNYKVTYIVKNINEKFYKIYSQGNPNSIKAICKKESVPSNIDEIISWNISKKKIVIALAGKLVNMDFLQSQRIKREACEKNMMFLGLIIFDEFG